MSEMVERVARTMHEAAGTDVRWIELSPTSRAFVNAMARAVIAAMREPTSDMRAAVLAEGCYDREPGEAVDCWHVIDAALKQ